MRRLTGDLIQMRLMVTLTIIGITVSLISCEKDSPVKSQICDSENKPAITDSSVNNKLKDITGKWYLTNTVNYGNQSFLKSSLLNQANKSNERDSLILRLKQPDNEVFASGWGNDCRGSYQLFMRDGKNWIYISDLGCTLLPVAGKFVRWEEKYFKALDNATCYKVKTNKLTVQYHINDAKKGKLIYQAIK